MERPRLLGLVIGSLLLSGCGTIFTFTGLPGSPSDSEVRPDVFGGVQLDARGLGVGETTYHGTDIGIFKIFLLIDLPLSLALDVVTIPVTVPIAIVRSNDPEEEARVKKRDEEARRLEERHRAAVPDEVQRLVKELSSPPYEANAWTLNNIILAHQAGIDAVTSAIDHTDDPALKKRLQDVLEKIKRSR